MNTICSVNERPMIGSLSFILIFALLMISLIASVRAQTASRPDRGFGGEGGYQTTGIDSISLQNGSLNVHIPLASLPPIAGGKLGYTLTAYYNSKLWEVTRSEVHIAGPDCGNRYITQDVSPGGGGWQIGGRYEIFFRRASEEFAYVQPFSEQCDGYADNYFMNLGNGTYFKPMLRSPDGAERELRIEGSFPVFENSSTTRQYMLGYYKSPGSGYPFLPDFAGPVRLYTIDGSYLTAVYDDASTTTRWTIYQKDGTRIEQSADGISQRTIDTNGNSILMGQRTGESFVQDEQTGREIKWSAITHNGQPATKVEYQSVGGNWQSVIVVWGTTVVTGKVLSQSEWNQLAEEPCMNIYPMSDTEMWVIREIIYPLAGAETVPRTFMFEYNSDATEQTNTPSENYCGQTFQSYTRNASLGWGELSEITTPTGAVIEYGYQSAGHDVVGIDAYGTPGGPAPGVEQALDAIVKTNLVGKVVVHDGTEDEWLYSSNNFYPDAPQSGMVTNPDGSFRQEWYFPSNTAYGLCCPGQNDGMRGQMIRSIDSNRIMTERSYITLGGMYDTFGAAQNVAANALVDTEYTTLLAEDGQTRLKMSAKKFEYDYNGDLTKTTEYDWFDPVAYTNNQSEAKYEYLEIPSGVPGNATVLRVTDNAYYNSPSDSVNNKYHKRTLGTTPVVLGKPKSSVISLASVAKARSEFYYDSAFNLTETRLWDSTKGTVSNPLTTGTNGNSISSFAEYAANGNVTETTDPKGNVTQITYGSVGSYTGLYPTQTVAAYGTAIARTSTAAYDFYTGLVTSATDVDNNLTNATEYDILGRPVKSITADNTSLESWTTTEYNDAARRVIVRSDLATLGDGRKVAVQHYDQLGRVRLSRSIENIATESPYEETHGIKVETRYQTVNPNSYQLNSNPFRAATATQATNEPTMGWTRSKSWNTGRKQEVETFTGASLPAPWGTNSSSTGVVTTDIDANATTVTDQAGRLRRSITNALGQLIRIDEPNGSNQLGDPVSPNQATSYEYSTLGKMVHVQQGVQHRYFMYSSLGRLLRVRQPEQDINTSLNTSGNPSNNSWTAGFTYDDNGNVLTATDAKGTTITNTYDALNRRLNRTYSDGTPTVTNYYDGTGLPSVPDFSKGKLTRVSSTVSDSRYTDYDVMGRLEQYQQITDGQTYTSSYEYNLSGALIKETYPSGRVVENVFDASGDLAKIFGKATPTSTERTYANNFTYSPDGKIERLKLGSGVWESAKFNSRLQVTELSVGWGPSSGSVWKMTTEYGELQTNGTVDATKNSGNIGKQTVTFNGLAHPFVQTFKYDPLYRLTEAKETSNSSQTWKQVFDYDRYGNRLSHDKFIGTSQITLDEETHPDIDEDTNRFESTEGYTFDENGNVIVDTSGRQFTFNGDNKQTEVKTAQDELVGKYFYDGEGKRVKKMTYDEDGDPKDVTVFVYSGGKLIAEYSTEAPPTNPTTRFTVTDQLGSPRVILDSAGDVVSRRDFLPFGEEIDADTTYRTEALKYGQIDHVRQKFTGYQNDDETGLDFAEARMYENRHGRFTAVDPLLASGKSADPQTFNRYVYVLNSPLVLTDPSGLQAGNWYKPITPDEAHTYVYETSARPNYEPVTERNRRGDLIGTGVGLDANHVLRFNPSGPYRPVPSFNSDSPSGSILPWFLLSDFDFKGYDVIATDAYEDASIEHPADGFTRGSEFAFSPVDFGIAGAPFKFSAIGRAGVTNPVPGRLARVIPGEGPFSTLGRSDASDVFVTAADDIAGLNAAELAPRLGIPPSRVFSVYEFPTPPSGISSPVFRPDQGFVGFGRTTGGAREFSIPNGAIPCGAVFTRVC